MLSDTVQNCTLYPPTLIFKSVESECYLVLHRGILQVCASRVRPYGFTTKCVQINHSVWGLEIPIITAAW